MKNITKTLIDLGLTYKQMQDREALALEYIINWFTRQTKKSQIYINNEGEKFIWFSYETLAKEMPLSFNIKSSSYKISISRIISKLVKLKLIKKITKNIFPYGYTTYFAPTLDFMLAYYSTNKRTNYINLIKYLYDKNSTLYNYYSSIFLKITKAKKIINLSDINILIFGINKQVPSTGFTHLAA